MGTRHVSAPALPPRLTCPTLVPCVTARRTDAHCARSNRTHANDDHVSFNTQTSTQVDGFRHYPYQNWPKEGEYTYYGGMSTDEAKDVSNHENGVQSAFRLRPIALLHYLIDCCSLTAAKTLPNTPSLPERISSTFLATSPHTASRHYHHSTTLRPSLPRRCRRVPIGTA
jgi:hypothetical protein